MLITDLRPEVLAFAFSMEAMLRVHDQDKGQAGWKFKDAVNLSHQTIEHARKLRFGILAGGMRQDISSFVNTAAVANLAMMVADVCGCLPLDEALAEQGRVRDLRGKYTDLPLDDDIKIGGTD